jgi:hypothetical protein
VITTRAITRRLPARRTAVGVVLVLAHLVVATGLPVPAAAAKSACGRACGCPPERVRAGTCCCSTPAPKPCCASHSAKPASCCAAKRSCCDNKPTLPIQWLPGWQAAECHGGGPAGLLTLPPAVPPAPPTDLVYEPGREERVAVRPDRVTPIPSRPPTPPPKSV